MAVAAIVIQVIVGLMLAMSGVMKFSKQMVTEFKRYRYPQWFRAFTGIYEVVASVLLLVGIWVPVLGVIGAAALAVAMLGGVLTHARIKDPFGKMIVPLVLGILSLAALFLIVGNM